MITITIGTRIRFRPSGWGGGKDYPGVTVPDRVTGVVIYVTEKLCVVEAEVDGVPIREAFGIRRGLLQDRSLEVVHG